MKRKRIFSLFVVLALVALVGCAIPSLPTGSAPVAPQSAGQTQAPFVSIPQAVSPSDLEATFENIYARVNPSVVTIEAVQQATSPILSSRFFGSQPPALSALGSGFVFDAQGNIITNNHIIEGADQISVVFPDENRTIVPGKVVGADPDSDLAVIKVNLPGNELHPVQFADSNQVKVGQLAIAIGNPFGEENSMTTGIISAIGRTLPVNSNAQQGPSYTIPDLIQTDAPINPGNSGGVLLNMQGQVIGVTFALESPNGTSAGIGFAIPSTVVQKVAPTLIKTGRYEHTYLGVSGLGLTPSLAQAMGLKPEQRGALIADVSPGGPAEKAGLRSSSKPVTLSGMDIKVGGDVITAVNGQQVKSFDDLTAYLTRSTQVNQTVTLTVLRDGKEQAIKVTLLARPKS